MPIADETQTFRDAMAFFVNRGMVVENKIEIHPIVLDAIREGEIAKRESCAPVRSPRILGKVFTSVTHDLQLVDLDYQTQVEFARTASSVAESSPDGAKLMEAVEKAFAVDELDTTTIEAELDDLLAASASDSMTTVEKIMQNAADRAVESSVVKIEYSIPLGAIGDDQLKNLHMAFASGAVYAGGRNFPMDSGICQIRPTAYSVVDELVLQHLPLFNLPLFCPFACVILTRDQHRAATSSFALIREAVFLWMAHAIEITNIPVNTKKNDRDRVWSQALKAYKRTVKSITSIIQPYAETFRERFNAFEGKFENNSAAFYSLVSEFTIGLTFLLWECVIGMYEIPQGGGMSQLLSVATITASSAHFTDLELDNMQKHHTGILKMHASDLEEDDTSVRVAHSEMFVKGKTPETTAPQIQDGVDAFLAHSMQVNSIAPDAWPETTMGELRDLWLYCKELVAANQPIWPEAMSDVMALLN